MTVTVDASDPIPALIGIRCIVTQVIEKHREVTVRWYVEFSPLTEAVRAKCIASTKIRRAIEAGLFEIGKLISTWDHRMIPTLGSCIEVVWGRRIAKNVTNGKMFFAKYHFSQTRFFHTFQGKIVRENDRIIQRAKAERVWTNRFEIMGRVLSFGLWKPAPITLEGLTSIPTEPGEDYWDDGAARLYITPVLQESFNPICERLWKAAFADGSLALQLERQGLQLDESDKTKMAIPSIKDGESWSDLLKNLNSEEAKTRMDTPAATDDEIRNIDFKK